MKRIVKDPEKTIQIAQDISEKASLIIAKEGEKLIDDEGDPAEQIYYVVHTMGALIYRILKGMDEYSKMYGMEKLTRKIAREWIDSVVDGYIESDKDKNKE